ncbi:hypothetical protein HYX02_01850 [Candidatus Woesearchaeota archaeon]|nr:hypothetical protein [Candidatus Woesearchaeota archaeon]
MEMMCHDGVCGKCWAAKFIVVGLVLIANQYWFGWDIWVVIGVLLVLKGVLKLAMPGGCGHCKPSEMKKGKK